ncbi:MAG: hypothetical protein GY714_04755 [Desulfobacterales bacterium]|nr:hypothetical protein [Desulfobacterales bacterium]MCP4163709.1 hypothetical protein [Deltaproteobacteria bacterium]
MKILSMDYGKMLKVETRDKKIVEIYAKGSELLISEDDNPAPKRWI